MYKVLVFAGTTEGYEICRFLADHRYRQRDLLPQSMAANPLQKMNFLLFRPEDWMQQPWRRPFYRRNRKWCWMLLILMLLR